MFCKNNNVVVSAAACRTSGAKTIFLQFLAHLEEWHSRDLYYIFIDENMPCPKIDGVEYIRINVRNGFKRLKFDWFECRRLLANRGVVPDLVISLQNTGISCLKNIPQIIYYHQSLPFYPQFWNPIKRDERTLAFYKWIYPFFVISSYKKEKVDFIAQIPFIKDGIVHRYKVNSDKVHVLFPDVEDVDCKNLKSFLFEPDTYNFLYPAVNAKYKNHLLLPEMIRELSLHDKIKSKNVRIHLTLTDSEIPSLQKKIERYGLDGNFVFHGVIPHQDLLSMYSSCHGLLFPSTIETLGLPLIEAARFGKGIIVSDLAYARQVMGDYQGVSYVEPYNVSNWAKQICMLCSKTPKIFPCLKKSANSSWGDFFKFIDYKLANQ